MHPALKGALHRLGTVLLATIAGGGIVPREYAHGAIAPGQAEAGPAEQEAWSAAQRTGTAMAYQRYLELYPVGAHMEEAFRLIVERSLSRTPSRRLVEIEPALGPPGGGGGALSVAAARLSLY